MGCSHPNAPAGPADYPRANGPAYAPAPPPAIYGQQPAVYPSQPPPPPAYTPASMHPPPQTAYPTYMQQPQVVMAPQQPTVVLAAQPPPVVVGAPMYGGYGYGHGCNDRTDAMLLGGAMGFMLGNALDNDSHCSSLF